MKKIILFTCLACGGAGLLVSAGNDLLYEAAARRFSEKIPLNPVVNDGDPYRRGNRRRAEPSTGAVCAVRYRRDRVHYELKTFRGEGEALRNNFIVTHRGPCGTCSTMRDLSVYMKRRDLTTPVRRCSLRLPVKSWAIGCLMDLGFSSECAETWYYNMVNTARQCGYVCAVSWLKRESLNGPDGSLNRCIACDEEKSGPVFKRVAGRTRRNSGIESAIRRQKGELYRINHDYY